MISIMSGSILLITGGFGGRRAHLMSREIVYIVVPGPLSLLEPCIDHLDLLCPLEAFAQTTQVLPALDRALFAKA